MIEIIDKLDIKEGDILLFQGLSGSEIIIATVGVVDGENVIMKEIGYMDLNTESPIIKLGKEGDNSCVNIQAKSMKIKVYGTKLR